MSGRDYYPVNQPAQQGYGGRTYAPPANSQGQQQRQDSYSSNQQQHQGDYSQNSYDDSYSHQQQQSSNGAAAYYDQNQYHQQSYQDNYGGGSSPYGNPSSHQDQYFSQANGNGGYGGHSPNLNASPQPGYNDGSDVGRGLMSDYNEPGAYPSGGLGAPYKAGSMASDSMANLNNDYDSVHELWRGQGPRPSGDNASYNGSSIALEKYEDGGWNSSGGRGPSKLGMGGTAGDVDPYDARAAGLAKYGVAKNTSNSKKAWMLAGIALLVVCLAGGAVALVYEFVIKKKGGGSIFGGGDSSEKTVTFGGNGSTVTFTNGTKYVYINPHGGTWNSEPFNDTAQAQSYTPPLNEEFDFVKNRILGVNLGSWFVTEPFIVPGLYQPYANLSTPIGDEYDLSLKYLQDGGKANLEKQMRQHYETFITEEDFAMIAAAGLNWVRMPFGFWAIETYDDEPYLEGVAWEYIQRAIGWARKYGIRINLDLHAVPGSQNGYNHSGKLGNLNWLNGPMGYANAQRTLNIIRTVTEFLSQPEIKNVVPMFSVLNEPNIPVGIGMDHLQNFMAEVYTMVRNITGEGKGNGPIMTLHDGFMGLTQWQNFLRGSDRVFYDEHPYICFGTPQTNDWATNLPRPCNSFANDIDKALTNNGMAMAGEWSLAVNDCSLYLNNVGVGARFDGSYSEGSTSYGSCEPWNDWENYNATTKSNLKDFALVQMDSLKNFFFWTWKIGDSIETGKPVNPMWSYKLGLQEGWMPENPATDPEGACESVGSRFGVAISSTTLWQSTFSDWMTGGAATYTVVPTSSGNNWPPSVVSGSNQATFSLATIPSYAQTGSVITLPVANMTSSTKPTATVTIDGWENSADTNGWFTSIAGCTYPTDAYTIANNDFGDWPCGANARRDHVDAAGRHHKRASPTQIDPRHEAPRSIATPAP